VHREVLRKNKKKKEKRKKERDTLWLPEKYILTKSTPVRAVEIRISLGLT
jgi:hypothetical protein